MWGFFRRRVVSAVVTLALVSVLVFLLIRLAPGDPAQALAGADATPDVVERIRSELGLDRPVWVQYGTWIAGALRGDLGRSAITGRQVAAELPSRFWATFELTLFAMIVATIFGVVAGLIAATKRGTAADTSVMVMALIGQSMPVFWLALMLISFFAVQNPWLPIQGRLPTRLDTTGLDATGLLVLDVLIAGRPELLGTAFRHLILPTLALCTIPLALVARMTRASALEVLQQDYIRTARAKGVRERRVVFRHALRNALIPVVTVIGINFGTLLGGAILTETIFSWPGLGRYLVDAVYRRDYPVIQGSVLLICSVVVLVNFLVDATYALLNPKVQYG